MSKTPPTSDAQIWTTGTRVAAPLVGNEREIRDRRPRLAPQGHSNLSAPVRTGAALREGHPILQTEAARPAPPPCRGETVVVPPAVRQRGGAHLYYADSDPNQDFDALDGDVSEAFVLWQP